MRRLSLLLIIPVLLMGCDQGSLSTLVTQENPNTRKVEEIETFLLGKWSRLPLEELNKSESWTFYEFGKKGLFKKHTRINTDDKKQYQLLFGKWEVIDGKLSISYKEHKKQILLKAHIELINETNLKLRLEGGKEEKFYRIQK